MAVECEILRVVGHHIAVRQNTPDVISRTSLLVPPCGGLSAYMVILTDMDQSVQRSATRGRRAMAGDPPAARTYRDGQG
jgi:hypothetical protein